MNPKISFIIPVYNAEKYIKNCIISIKNQNIPNDEFEIITIDDGSSDKSTDIIQDLQNEIPSLILLKQKNKGASVARNRGVQVAKGTFIQFVDADDSLVPYSVSKLLLIAINENLDILCFDFESKTTQNGIEQYYSKSDFAKNTPEIYSGIEYLITNNFFCSPCMAMYNLHFFSENHLSFREGVMCEDVDFAPISIYKAKRIKYCNEKVYIYNKTENSVTTNYQIKFEYDLLKAIYIVYLYFEKCVDWKQSPKLQSVICRLISTMVQIQYNRSIYYSIRETFIFYYRTKRERKKIKVAFNTNKYTKSYILFSASTYFPMTYSLILEFKKFIIKINKQYNALTSCKF